MLDNMVKLELHHASAGRWRKSWSGTSILFSCLSISRFCCLCAGRKLGRSDKRSDVRNVEGKRVLMTTYITAEQYILTFCLCHVLPYDVIASTLSPPHGSRVEPSIGRDDWSPRYIRVPTTSANA